MNVGTKISIHVHGICLLHIDNNDHLTCLVGMQSQVAPGLYPPGGFGGVQGMK